MARVRTRSSLHIAGIKAVLMDIEGTICSISFVKDKMYPYSLAVLPSTLSEYFSAADRKSSPLAPYIAAFPERVQDDEKALLAHIKDLIEADVKDTALKKLQGYLWRSGFDAGMLQAPLFEDVEPKWNEWKGREEPLQLAIYSSGSVEAQKMLLGHVGPSVSNGLSRSGSSSPQSSRTLQNATDSRSLLHLFDDYFDTENAGSKLMDTSYDKIATALQKRPNEILFLSDNPLEIRAALKAGLHAVLVQRPGNAPLSDRELNSFLIVQTFANLEI